MMSRMYDEKPSSKTKKAASLICASLLFASIAFAQNSGSVLRFKQRIGFDNGELIEQVRLLDNRAKVLLIGRSTIQEWDLLNAIRLNSYQHEIKKRGGEEFQVSPDGKLLVGVRDRFVPLNLKKDDRPDAASIYDLSTGKLVAFLQRPDRPIRSVEWSRNGKTIVTFSNTLQKETEICFWSASDFSLRSAINIKGYGWYYLTQDGTKLYVGSGGLSFFEKMYGPTTGSEIHVYNALTGKLESALVAATKYRVAYGTTFITPDEKYLATQGNGKIVVWDLLDKSERLSPKYEIAASDPKKKVRLEGASFDSRFWIGVEKGKRVYYETTSGQLTTDIPQLVNLKFDYHNFITVPGSQIAIAQDCGGAKILDSQTSKQLYEVRFSCYSVDYENGLSSSYTNDFAMPDDGGNLLLDFEDVPKSKDRVLIIRNLKSGEILETLSFPMKPVEKEYAPKWGAGNWWVKDRYVFAIGQNDRSILIWELNSGDRSLGYEMIE